ncbi:sigma-54-dependent transcriptional regulator [Desulfatiglans anilini]|uniref:sigma-54-dependent transcriptional regulator n=1 Tax=Desulfatiglans anilini TaxID=90728 RepID=UPI0004045B31|nr:sigma-54 dependent transcriptional regulator [Desulfatiglans anilini]
MAETILIVEDEDTLRESLTRVFEREGYEVVPVSSAEPAMELFEEGSFDLILTDIILPGMTGIELIKRVKEAAPEQACIVMTAYASLETAVETLRAGAYDYIVKPIIHEEIKQTVRNALKLRALQEENAQLREQVAGYYDTRHLIGAHPAIASVRDRVHKVAEARSPVLLTGEIGTGKKLVARMIHEAGSRMRLPFLEVHCEALSPAGQEEALFGGRGAQGPQGQTGARGLLERARGGTVYLNRVDALALPVQQLLLSVLSEGRIRPAGGGADTPFGALIISGTEKGLGAAVAEGRFLGALQQRLRVAELQLPPLRERGEDIQELAAFFVSRYNRAFGKAVEGLAPEAWARLQAYAWPGNVLELRNLLERAVLLTRNGRLQPADFPPLS